MTPEDREDLMDSVHKEEIDAGLDRPCADPDCCAVEDDDDTQEEPIYLSSNRAVRPGEEPLSK